MRQQMRRMHGELPQPEAEQDARELHVAGHLAAHRYRLAGLLGAADDVGDQLQHGRMQGVVQMRDGVVGAVDGQRVLDQVVGADGDEIQALDEAPSDSAAAGTSIMPPTLISPIVGDRRLRPGCAWPRAIRCRVWLSSCTVDSIGTRILILP